MMNFLKQHNIITRVLALILAICLWVIVMKDKNPGRAKTISDIPITFVGTETLLADQGLAVIGGQNQKISLHIEGLTSDIGRLEKSGVLVEVDLTQETEAGTRAFPYTVSLPKNLNSLQVRQGKPESIELTLDHMVSKTIPVSVELSAEASETYRYETPIPLQKEVTLHGPETILSTIQTAHIVLPSDALTQNISLSCEYSLLDANGAAVESPYVTKRTKKITVSLGVNKIATVPLAVDIVPGEDVTEDMAQVTISPSTVQVYGAPSAIDRLEQLTIDTIRLATEQTATERTVAIRLPAGIKLLEDEPTTATITLQIDGMGSRTISISEIRQIDQNQSVSKPQIDFGDVTVQVTLRGKNSMLTGLNAADVKASATFDSSKLTEGSNQIPITVALPDYSQGVTILSYTDTITVQVTGAAAPPPDVPPAGDGV